MSWMSRYRVCRAKALLLAILLGAMANPADAQMFMRRVTLDDLVKDSDSICVGTCTKKEVVYRDGKIISRYQIKPSQFLKGGIRLSSAGEFLLEQQGGSLEKPLPITQMNLNSAHLNTGQEVVLFTEEPEADGGAKLQGASPSPTQGPRLVGGDHGVFSIVRNPENGEKLVLQGSAAGRMNNLDVAALTKAEAARRQKAAPTSQKPQPKAAGASLASAGAQDAADEKAQIKPIERLDVFAADVKNLLGQGKSN